MDTENNQEVKTPETENKVETKVETPETEKKVEVVEKPYKSFATQEEFDKHSAGILNNAKYKAEKELLAMLGLKPDEKDKLAKFKEAYENTLSESEKQTKNIEELTSRVSSLENELKEKEATIVALSKMSNKSDEDVTKLVKMARGLVDDNTTIEQAIEQVLAFTNVEPKSSLPKSKPLNESDVPKIEDNPFKSGNLTKQGEMMKMDREKARSLYISAFGKSPNW